MFLLLSAGGMTKGAGERTKDPAPLIGGTPRGASLPPPEFLPPSQIGRGAMPNYCLPPERLNRRHSSGKPP